MCLTVMCSTVLHNKNKAIQNTCADFATRIHLQFFFFFCCLNCFKKILNVKILVWEFCRKTHISPSVRPVSPFPNSSAPSVRAQGPYLLARDQCKMITVKHQPATAPENTQPLRDPEMSKLGGFGPKHTSLCSFIK